MSDPGNKPPRGVGDDPTEAMNEPPQPALPERIGHYRLLSVLGEGGFGIVYLAEQTEPVRRRVALKVIKPGMDSAAVVARFEAERQALAVMDHPGVARVFDAGTTPEGRPYFVMEHVKGVRITEHCDRQRLNLRQRIELFIQVCEAIQHAHMKGVIHRDLKPGNILVEYREGAEGMTVTPKVIDFGVAKSLDRPLTDRTLYTEVGQLIGTPEYMSPEQAGTSGQDIDTRADIYALGVVLYELLAGSPPFQSSTLREAGFGEVLRFIREVEPARPSTRVSLVGDSPKAGHRTIGRPAQVSSDRLEQIVAQRRTDPRSLRRALRGDLDWIVMKCLEKDRARRYETANALAMDLGRYLRSEPVLAGPPGATYRLGKFIRRHRVPVAAGAGVFVALIAGVVGIALALAEANRQRAAAELARAEAQQRAVELGRVAEFQASMLSGLDPERIGRSLLREMGDQLQNALAQQPVPLPEHDDLARTFDQAGRVINPTDIARWLLDDMILSGAVEAIDRQFHDQPLIEAALRQTVGEVYRALGMHPPALLQLERALAIRNEQLGPDHRDTLTSRMSLGIVLLASDRPDEAHDHLLAAAESFRRLDGDGDPRAVGAAIHLAMALLRLNRIDEALAWGRSALEAAVEGGGEDDPQTLVAVNNMGVIHQAMGDWQQAEAHFLQALDGRRRVFGEHATDTLVSYQNVGLMFWAQYRLDEAQPYLENALRLARRIHGEDHPVTLEAATSLAVLMQGQGRLAEAERLLSRTLEAYRQTLGDRHHDTLKCLANLATVFEAQGRAEQAERAYREALTGLRATAGPDDRLTLIQMSNLGLLLADQGRLDEAEGYLREAVDRGRRTLGEIDDVLIWANNLAGILRDLERFEEALVLTELAVDGARDSMPPAYLGRFLMTRARTLAGLGRWADATGAMEEAYRIVTDAMGEGSDWAREAAADLAKFYDQWSLAEPGRGHAGSAAKWRIRLRGSEGDAGD